jgi:hypothetical protein
MKNLTEDLLKKLAQLDRDVKNQLRAKGFVVPIKGKNGSIKFGWYTVVRNNDGSYAILDHANEAIVSGINLPQTALITANSLALGKHKDSQLIDVDKKYGYADFKEQLYKRAVERVDRSLDYFDINLEKHKTALHKKAVYKREITKSFEKLTKLL